MDQFSGPVPIKLTISKSQIDKLDTGKDIIIETIIAPILGQAKKVNGGTFGTNQRGAGNIQVLI